MKKEPIIISKRVLLIEDNEKDIELTLVALDQCNMRNNVIVANTGRQALSYLFYQDEYSNRTHEDPCLILLDLKMPQIDGFEILQKIKDDKTLQKIPIVVFTSSTQDNDIIKSYELGANAYINKPIDFTEFQKVVKITCEFWLTINKLPPDCLENNMKK